MGKRSRRILTGFGVVIVALGVVYAVMMIRATGRLRRAYAALEADGRPMRTAEIIPPKVPDSDNAAVLYQSAVLLLKGQPAGDKSLFEQLTARASAARKEAQKKWIAHEAVTNALSLLAEGTQRPTCQIEHNHDNVLEVMGSPFLEDWRNLVSIMTARIRFEAEAGNPAKAWDLLLTQLRLADSLRLDPSSDTQFTRQALTAWASRTMRVVCETALPAVEHLQAIDDLLRRQDDVEPLVRAVDGERLLIGEWFFNLPKEELDKILWRERSDDKVTPPRVLKAIHRLSFTVLAFKPRLISDHAAYLELMRKRVHLLQGPYRDRKEIARALQSSHWNILTHKLTWSAGNEKWFYCRLLADSRVTRAGLAVLQYRQAHDAFPESLDAVGLEGLLDPFTEKPLHYRPEGEGFVVYSVGDDLKDNGGTPMRRREDSDPRRKPVEYDQLWRFPVPENRAAAGDG